MGFNSGFKGLNDYWCMFSTSPLLSSLDGSNMRWVPKVNVSAGWYFNKNVDYRATCPHNIYLCVGWRLPDTTWSHEAAASPSNRQTWMLDSLLRSQQRHLRWHHSLLQWSASQAHAKWRLSGLWWSGRQCQFHNSRDANPAATHFMQVRTTSNSAQVSVVNS